MIRKYLVKSAALFVALTLAMNTVACGVATPASGQGGNTSAPVTQRGDYTARSAGAGSPGAISSGLASDKVETVYVMSDAKGGVNKVIVSDWLKNADKAAEISDTTSLTDIVNVKGNASYTDKGDGTILWNTSGDDVYYQGSTKQELPIDLKVSYKLDGKDIAPSDLAGKKGKVTIRFDYTNKAKQRVQIGGRDTDIYVPFTMISGVVLDNSRFSHVEVTNGKVVSDAGNYLVMGIALPGLKESLALDHDKLKDLDLAGEDVEIPEFVEITADTTDFRLDMTLTMASSDALSDLGLTGLAGSDKIDKVKADVNRLSDGSKQLVDGGYRLQEGICELRDGTGRLGDGSQRLYDGTSDLYKGISDYTRGTSLIHEGTEKLAAAANQLRDGAAKLDEGTGALAVGAGKLKDGTGQVTDGISRIRQGTEEAKTGSAQLRKGYEDNQVVDNARTLAYGTAQVKAGVNQLAGRLEGLAMGVTATEAELLANQRYAREAYLWLLNGTEVPAEDKIAVDALMQQLTGEMARSCGGNTGSMAEWEAIKQQMETDQRQVQEDSATLLRIKSQSDALSTQLDSAIQYFETMQKAAGTADNTTNSNREAVAVDNEKRYAEPTAEDTVGVMVKGETYKEAPAEEISAEEVSHETSLKMKESLVGTPEEAGAPVPEETKAEETKAEETKAEEAKAGEGKRAYTFDEAAFADLTPEQRSLAKQFAMLGVDSNENIMQALNMVAQMQSKAVTEATIGAQKNGDKIKEEVGGNVQILATALTLSRTANNTYEDLMGTLDKPGCALRYAKEYGAVQAAAAACAGSAGALGQVEEKLVAGTQNMDLTQLQQLVEGAGQIADGSTALSSGLAQLYAGTTRLDEGLGVLSKGMDSLYVGAKQASDSAGTLANASLTLEAGTSKLAGGARELADATATLDKGTSSLITNNDRLINGAGGLRDGANELNKGVKDLDAGSAALAEGVDTLVDGLVQLDEEGIQKLAQAFNGNLADFTARVDAIRMAGTEYTTFAGSHGETPSSVKFIIKTEGIEEGNK